MRGERQLFIAVTEENASRIRFRQSSGFVSDKCIAPTASGKGQTIIRSLAQHNPRYLIMAVYPPETIIVPGWHWSTNTPML